MPIAIAGWLTLAVLVAPFVLGLGRAAAIGDQDQSDQMRFATDPEADLRSSDRRSGAGDRRAAHRPWGMNAAGRRAEDVHRREVAAAYRDLSDAEARVVELEARRTG